MTDFNDLKQFFSQKDYQLIIAADAEPVTNKMGKDGMVTTTSAGGVAVALEPVANAAKAIFIARGKTLEDAQTVDANGKMHVTTALGEYNLKRLFFSPEDTFSYYYGFANQSLWPLCHIAFERPIFSPEWYEGFKKVNKDYADAILKEVEGKKTMVWINDYQLSLVPSYIGKQKDLTIGMFWHIPWPTWEIFRILPQKNELLQSMLACDFIGFHRGYQARNFLDTVGRELPVRIDLETNRIYYNNHITTVRNLPMGIDTDVIKELVGKPEHEKLSFMSPTKDIPTGKEGFVESIFGKRKVILGTDRLDYTKGLPLRLQALDVFFKKNPQYIGEVTYVGVLAPSRQEIPSYVTLRQQLMTLMDAINSKYARADWQPINLVEGIFSRKEIMEMYKKAAICLVTPLDDGMNLVSKEYVIAASFAKKPGMLVLSQFAGSAIDLTQALIVNPYDLIEVANAIKKGLEMPSKEKQDRMNFMTTVLEDRNVYEWAEHFLRETEYAGRENRKMR